jgi:hypothetical protein
MTIFAVVGPGEVSPHNNVKHLLWQTAVSAHTDAKSFFGALANRPRSPDPENACPAAETEAVAYDERERIGTIIKRDGQYDAFDKRAATREVQ